MPTDPQRSRTMAAVRSRDTAPERKVQQWLKAAGFRVQHDVKRLPGRPDFVVPAARVAIFVHGCWWHGHDCPRGARIPKSNRTYWLRKIHRNAARDRRVTRELRAMGYSVWTLWECRLKRDALPARLKRAIEKRLARRDHS